MVNTSTSGSSPGTTTNSITYVHDGIEVQCTGREATKTVRNVTDTLVEIAPADSQLPVWKKWVRPTDLYEIKKQNQ